MGISYRKAKIDDIESLVNLRIQFLKEINDISSKNLEITVKNNLTSYFEKTMTNESFIAFLAEFNGEIIATSGMSFCEKPPNGSTISGVEAYIMNMYTLINYRKNGIASELLKRLLEYCDSHEIRVVRLHAEEMGLHVYQKMGFFKENKEMKRILSK